MWRAMRLLIRTILPVALFILVFDRVTKWYVVDYLDLPNQFDAEGNAGRMEVWDPFLNLAMAWNTGINFGLGSDTSPWVLIGVAVAISAGLIFWSMRKGSVAVAVGAGLVVGGAIGNAWDRASDWGAVADFLNMSCCGIDNPFSFNVADIAIFLGAVWIAIRA